jgi:S-adenosylmethionine decarboxylase
MSGIEWVVEAFGCSPTKLRDLPSMHALVDKMIRELLLRPIGEPLWHQFPGSGGITGLFLLAESHLACHTFPEHGSLCLNLFCCVPRPEWNFHVELQLVLGAQTVSIRRLQRPYETLNEQAGGA